MTWSVPQKYFDLHPIERITLPPVKKGDLDDIPAFGKKLAKEVYDPSNGRNFAVKPNGDHENVMANKQWRKAIQAYLATISFADTQIGRVLDALDRSRHADNTIVVLWGDHGWHLGEHAIWGKHALFEESLHSPLIIHYKDLPQAGMATQAMVETLDVFPTLCDLAGLPKPGYLHGVSLLPLLKDPKEKGHVAIGYRRSNRTIRTDTHRLILHGDGFAELYDHTTKAGETRNVAKKHPELVKSLTEQMAKRLSR